MAGIARNYNANQIILGPADVWLDVNLPAPGARLSIDADGTPASTNTTAIHLGMTAAGVTFEYMPEIQDFTSDELTAPHMSRIISEKASLKGEFLQVFNWSLLAKMTVGGSLGTATGTAGYEELKMGGISSISTFSVALIGPDISNSSEFLRWISIGCAYFALYPTNLKLILDPVGPPPVFAVAVLASRQKQL